MHRHTLALAVGGLVAGLALCVSTTALADDLCSTQADAFDGAATTVQSASDTVSTSLTQVQSTAGSEESNLDAQDQLGAQLDTEEPDSPAYAQDYAQLQGLMADLGSLHTSLDTQSATALQDADAFDSALTPLLSASDDFVQCISQ